MDVEEGTSAEFITLSQLEALVIEEQAKDYTIRAKKLELLNQGIDLEQINAIDKEFDISTVTTPDYSEFQQNFLVSIIILVIILILILILILTLPN